MLAGSRSCCRKTFSFFTFSKRRERLRRASQFRRRLSNRLTTPRRVCPRNHRTWSDIALQQWIKVLAADFIVWSPPIGPGYRLHSVVQGDIRRTSGKTSACCFLNRWWSATDKFDKDKTHGHTEAGKTPQIRIWREKLLSCLQVDCGRTKLATMTFRAELAHSS